MRQPLFRGIKLLIKKPRDRYAKVMLFGNQKIMSAGIVTGVGSFDSAEHVIFRTVEGAGGS